MMAVVKGGEMSGSSATASSAASRRIGEEKPERGAAEAHQRRQQQAIDEGAAVVGIAERGQHIAQGKAAVLDKGALEQLGQREEDEEAQQDPEPERGQEQRGIASDPTRGRHRRPAPSRASASMMSRSPERKGFMRSRTSSRTTRRASSARPVYACPSRPPPAATGSQ